MPFYKDNFDSSNPAIATWFYQTQHCIHVLSCFHILFLSDTQVKLISMLLVSLYPGTIIRQNNLKENNTSRYAFSTMRHRSPTKQKHLANSSDSIVTLSDVVVTEPKIKEIIYLNCLS